MVIETENGRKRVTLDQFDEKTRESILEEIKQYQLVRTCITTWEKLDEDREGESCDVDVYPLGEENCPIDHTIIIKDNQFAGVGLFYTETTSWNAGLNKKKSYGGCTLYKDGTVTGSPVSSSSYDSPNNHDDVTITYALRKIK